MNVAQTLRTERERAGIAHHQLAALLGMSPSFLGQIESGRRPFPSAYLTKLPSAIRRAVIDAMLAGIVRQIEALGERASELERLK